MWCILPGERAKSVVQGGMALGMDGQKIAC
jgi:hypothetical protein